MKNKQDKIEIIYDGSCPLCQAGVKNFCSNDSEGRIIKINKRVERDHKTALEAEDAKLNVDEGFIVKYQDKFYQGRQAAQLISELNIGKGLIRFMGKAMFRNKTIGKFFYPILLGTRNILIKIKGIGPIDSQKR
ncbi:MAG: putative DCC family thiol-disulfide oxidoreductase YuxK [Rickettsiales bacterium]|jgi:predicted DCC family thiol-disulfide oxidoreductase YuxK